MKKGKTYPTEISKEIEENNRMGKMRGLFKKTGVTKWTFHTNIGTIKDENGKDITEAEEKELKNLLMKMKEEGEKVGLKLNIQKAKIMASDPITSWQIEGVKVEAETDYYLGLQNPYGQWLQSQN